MRYFCTSEGACDELTDGARPPTNTFRACSGRIAADAAAWLVLLRALLLLLFVLLAGIAAAWAAVRLCSPSLLRLTTAAAALPDAGTRLLVPLVVEGADDDLTSALVPNLDAPLPDDDVVDPLRLEEPSPEEEEEEVVVVVELEPEDEEGAGKESVASRGTARLTSTVRPSST